MPYHRLHVPALPVLLPLGVLLMIVSTVLLHRRGQLTAGRLLAAWCAGWYAVAVLGATMLPMNLGWGPGSPGPNLDQILWVPFADMRKRDFVLNTIMTLPLAALLHTVVGVRDARRVVGIGFLLGLGIELTQLILLLALDGQRWPDVHDVVSNTVGAGLGYLVFHRFMRSARFRRAVESCSCARTGHGDPAVVR